MIEETPIRNIDSKTFCGIADEIYCRISFRMPRATVQRRDVRDLPPSIAQAILRS